MDGMGRGQQIGGNKQQDIQDRGIEGSYFKRMKCKMRDSVRKRASLRAWETQSGISGQKREGE
jgi:hypothetical protein